MTPSGDGYPIDLAEEIIDLAGSFLEADRGSQCRAETHQVQPMRIVRRFPAPAPPASQMARPAVGVSPACRSSSH